MIDKPEQKNNEKNEKTYYESNNDIFFSRKKIIFICFWILISFTLIALSIIYVFNIDFKTIFNLISLSNKENSYFWLWFTLLFIFPIYNCVLKIFPYYYKMKQKKVFVRWYEWLSFSFFTLFLAAITPFAFGAEPYIMYWLKKRGISLREASAIVLSFSILAPITQIIITWPSFFIIASTYGINQNNVLWVSCFWLVFTGLIFDLIAAFFVTSLGYSKNLHYLINLFINKIKKILKLKYITKEQIKLEYRENQAFKKILIKEFKDMKFTIFLLISYLIWNAIYYSSLIFSFNLIDPNFSFSPLDLFNYVNVATTANNFIPLPGAEGTLQTTIIVFIKNTAGFENIDNIDNLVSSATYIWRTFTFYLTTILGAFAFIYILIKHSRDSIIKKLKLKKSFKLNKTFTFVIKDISEPKDLLNTLNSIRWCKYNQKFINIVIIIDNLKKIKSVEKEVLWFDIKIVKKTFKSNFEMLKYFNKNSIISTDYITILKSGEQITYETLDKINSRFIESDIYIGSFRRIIEKQQISTKKSPFPYFFDRNIKNIKKMSTIKFDMSTTYFKTSLINKIKSKILISDKDICLYNLLIQNSNNLRYENKIFVYKIKKIKKDWDLNTIISLVENNNKNLATEILLVNKKVLKEFSNSYYNFGVSNLKFKPIGFHFFKKIKLLFRYKWKVKKIIMNKK